jgi:glycosyltransferase involved in cell wall biosynthesis
MSFEMPLISVIVPVYNVEKYIHKCIASILSQDYTHIEIIIIDDGSPDNSGQISDQFAAKDERVRVIHQKNAGVSKARNRGIDEANGYYIIFVDPDDYLSPDFLDYMLQIQKKSGANFCLSTKCFIKINDEQTLEDKIEILSPENATALLLSPEVAVGCWNKLYSRHLLTDNHIRFSECLFSGEGLHFIITVSQYANCVGVGQKKVYYYRKNNANSATTAFNIEMFTNNEMALDLIRKNLRTKSPYVILMLDLFLLHLNISGLMAIIQNESEDKFQGDYRRWKANVKEKCIKMLLAPQVSLRSKIRILGAALSPSLCARLGFLKRKKEFRASV